MHRVRQQDLPFRGSSHEFVGADHGDVNVSVFLLSALPGRGPGPHRHPYDEVQFVREGRGLWTVNGEEFEAGAGDIHNSPIRRPAAEASIRAARRRTRVSSFLALMTKRLAIRW